MRILLVVSASKYTGAAAVAEHCCRALRSIGVEAVLLFVGGNNLEQRLAGKSWAFPALVKERSLRQVRSNLAAVRSAGRGTTTVISHLPHDHFLAVAAGAHVWSRLIRSVRNAGHLRRDPYHRFLMRRAVAAFLAHSQMARRLAGCSGPAQTMVLPVPIEDRFRPGLDTGVWRRRLGIPLTAPVIGMVGKLARGRGFRRLLDTAALIKPAPHVVVVGHGETRPALERRVQHLGLSRQVHWSGYQEQGLPELLAAIDVVLFTAPGSDHGHRAVTEAQACGRAVVAADIPGMRDLIEHGTTGLLAATDPQQLAGAVSELLGNAELRCGIAEQAATAGEHRRFQPLGQAMADFLSY